MWRKFPALPLLIAVVVGIVLADYAQGPSWLFLSVGLACVVGALGLVARGKNAGAVALSVVAIGSLAGFQYVIRCVEQGPRHVANVVTARQITHIFGEIADWPDLRGDHTDYVVEVDSVVTDGLRRVNGRILLRVTDTTTALQRGDRIELFGRIYLSDASAGSHNTTARRMALREICGTVFLPTLLNVRVDRRPSLGVFAMVDRVRSWILKVFDETLSPQAAALAGGFLLGETRQISPEVYTLFRDSGTLHVLAVSGSNVALVLLFTLLVLRPFGIKQPWRGGILLLVVVLFALLSYSQPSVIRASTMAAFIIVAGMLGREYNLNHIVSLTILVILLAAPSQLFDVGFQLSAVTAWGLVLLVKPVSDRFSRWHNTYWYRWLVFPAIVSVIAQICSAPLIAYYFGKVPIVSLPANLLVVPLTSLAVVLLMCILSAYLLLPILGFFLGSLVDPVMKFLIVALEWFHRWQWTSLDTGKLSHLPTAKIWIGVYFVVVVLGIFSMVNKKARRFALFVVVVAINGALVSAVVAHYDRPASVRFSSLPGGIIALVDQPSAMATDLIIGSGRVRIDNLDTRLIQPVLDLNRVKKLRHVFVLTLTFDVIDDLIRAALFNQCESLFVAEGNRASFEDYLVYHPEAKPPPIRYFGGDQPVKSQIGYSLDGNGILLRSKSHLFFFCFGTEAVEKIPESTPDADLTLVLAGRWSPAASEWIALKEQGVTRIVCSRIEQLREEDDDSGQSDDADLVLPEFTVDLYRTGPYRLSL